MNPSAPFLSSLRTWAWDIACRWWCFYESRLRRNWPGWFREFAPYLFLLLVVTVADLVTTCRFMVEGSVEDEAHPAIRQVSLWFGPYLGPLLGKSIQVAAVLFLVVLLRPHGRKILVPVIVSYGLAAGWNHWVTVAFLQPLDFLHAIWC
jgi:hypothetical protein